MNVQEATIEEVVSNNKDTQSEMFPHEAMRPKDDNFESDDSMLAGPEKMKSIKQHMI